MKVKIDLDERDYFFRCKVTPPASHPNALLKGIETIMQQCYGLSRARTYLDVVWHAEGGDYLLRMAAS